MEDSRVYRSINTKFWRDKKIKALDPVSKLLFLYLVTNDHTHVAGLYYLPEPVIPHETGLTSKQVDKAFNRLSKDKLAYYDSESESTLVVNMLDYQGNGGPKIKAAVNKQISLMSDSPLVELFTAKYDTLKIPYPRGIDTHTVPDTVPDTVPERIGMLRVVEIYHEQCPSFPIVKAIQGKREGWIKARIDEHPDEKFWQEYWESVEASDFLTGRDNKDIRPNWSTFDWFVRPTNFVKVMEGNYVNKEQANPNLLSYNEMMHKISTEGGSTDDYEPVYPKGGKEPQWMKK